MANVVDSNLTQHSVATDLGLHCAHVYLSLPVLRVKVSGERMNTILVNRLED